MKAPEGSEAANLWWKCVTAWMKASRRREPEVPNGLRLKVEVKAASASVFKKKSQLGLWIEMELQVRVSYRVERKKKLKIGMKAPCASALKVTT